MSRHSDKRKKISARIMALSMAAAMAVTLYPVPAFAEDSQNVTEKVQVLDKTGGNIHDYGKTGDDRQHRMWMNPQSLQILMY